METTRNGRPTTQPQRPQVPPAAPAQRSPRAEADDRIRRIFQSQRETLAGLFPEDGDTMVTRACSMALAVSRKVEASPDSIAAVALSCLHLGLELGDQAYAVPYKGNASLIVGPRGLIALAYRSGFVKSIVACSVFEPDMFEYELGDKPFIRHRKATEARRDAPITHAYSVIETTTEGTIREVLTREDLDYYRSFSKATGGPWETNFEGMCRKTVLKRVLEYVPRSALLAAALRENEEGKYEIPEEIWAAVKTRGNAPAEAPIEVAEELTDDAIAREIDQGKR
jgi:recombination protein RecT